MILIADPLVLQWQKEAPWLDHVHESMSNFFMENSPNISWSAFHAKKERDNAEKERDTTERERDIPRLTSTSALLPLFHEKSTFPSMIKHGMDIVMNLTKYLNNEQIPVICLDQQLYTICKLIQFNWPSVYGPDKFVALMGPLHIEQSFLRVVGQLLEGSGWSSIIADSGIASMGSAEGFLKVCSLFYCNNKPKLICVQKPFDRSFSISLVVILFLSCFFSNPSLVLCR